MEGIQHFCFEDSVVSDVSGAYCIAGNFCGRKPLQISQTRAFVKFLFVKSQKGGTTLRVWGGEAY